VPQATWSGRPIRGWKIGEDQSAVRSSGDNQSRATHEAGPTGRAPNRLAGSQSRRCSGTRRGLGTARGDPRLPSGLHLLFTFLLMGRFLFPQRGAKTGEGARRKVAFLKAAAPGVLTSHAAQAGPELLGSIDALPSPQE
jgi:hypothetical protein